MISASRSGRRFDPARRFLISCFHSRMFHSCDAPYCSDKGLPFFALHPQNASPFGSQAIVAAPPFIGFFDPTPLNPATFFEPVQQRIERRNMEMKHAAGALLDKSANVIAMARLSLYKRKNQQFGAALFPFIFNRRHMCDSHMWYGR